MKYATLRETGVGRSNFKLGVFRFQMDQSTRTSNLKFARPTPIWRLASPLQLNKFRPRNFKRFAVVLISDVVELGSGDQISHLVGVIGIFERPVQPDLLIPRSLRWPNLKFEHPTPNANYFDRKMKRGRFKLRILSSLHPIFLFPLFLSSNFSVINPFAIVVE
jgi:hypothetical protein